MKSLSAAMIDRVVASAAAPLFRSAGFKKRGRSFHQGANGFFRVADFQASRWNDPDRASFTLNLGVTMPGFDEVYASRAFPSNPASSVRVVSQRIGYLLGKTDVWWEVPGEDEQDAATAVGSAVGEHALPFLAQFQTLDDVKRVLEQGGHGIEAVQKQCLAWLLTREGEQQRACTILRALSEASKVEGYVAIVDDFAARCGLQLDA